LGVDCLCQLTNLFQESKKGGKQMAVYQKQILFEEALKAHLALHAGKENLFDRNRGFGRLEELH
jgi:hypothetical protein